MHIMTAQQRNISASSIRDNISMLFHLRPIPKGTNGRILVLQKKLTPVRTGGSDLKVGGTTYNGQTPAKCQSTEV